MSTVSHLSARRRGPRALFMLMAQHHGVASSAQARAAGVSRAVEARLVAEGALVRLGRGIVAAGGVALTFSAQAKAATLRPGVSAISHGAAARLHCMPGFEQHASIDVIGGRGSHIRVAAPSIARYSRGPIAEHVTMIGSIPVTSIALTLTLLMPDITRAHASALVADAIGRGVPVAAIREVAEQWRDPGRTGPAELLEILGRAPDGRRRSA